MSSESHKEMRLGTLLVQLDLLSENDLKEASQLAVELGLPLGKVLVMSDFITDSQLTAIVQAQSMLKDQLIDLEVARRSLEIVSDKNLAWADALKEAGWIEPQLLPTNKLGKLLVEAGIIEGSELENALSSATQSGLPLGRILSASGRVSEQTLVACLNAQVLLRDGKINRQQAVKGLKAAAVRQTSLEQELIDTGEYKPPAKVRIKLGELFVMARLLSESIMMDVIERGLVSEEPIGQVLLKGGHVNANQLETALHLQQFVDDNKLSPINCAEILRQVCLRNITVEEAMRSASAPREAGPPRLTLADLLKLSGVLSEEDVAEAFRRSMQNPQVFGRILVMTGFIDEPGLEVSLRCQEMVQNGQLREDQAIIALNYCARMHCTLEQAAVELGWTTQARNQFSGRKRTERDDLAAAAAKKALKLFD